MWNHKNGHKNIYNIKSTQRKLQKTQKDIMSTPSSWLLIISLLWKNVKSVGKSTKGYKIETEVVALCFVIYTQILSKACATPLITWPTKIIKKRHRNRNTSIQVIRRKAQFKLCLLVSTFPHIGTTFNTSLLDWHLYKTRTEERCPERDACLFQNSHTQWSRMSRRSDGYLFAWRPRTYGKKCRLQLSTSMWRARGAYLFPLLFLLQFDLAVLRL